MSLRQDLSADQKDFLIEFYSNPGWAFVHTKILTLELEHTDLVVAATRDKDGDPRYEVGRLDGINKIIKLLEGIKDDATST